MGLLQMDALMGLRLPLLHQQDFVLLLGGEIVVVADTALLPADGIGNALHHDLTDEGLPAAGLGRIGHIQGQGCALLHGRFPPQYRLSSSAIMAAMAFSQQLGRMWMPGTSCTG